MGGGSARPARDRPSAAAAAAPAVATGRSLPGGCARKRPAWCVWMRAAAWIVHCCCGTGIAAACRYLECALPLLGMCTAAAWNAHCCCGAGMGRCLLDGPVPRFAASAAGSAWARWLPLSAPANLPAPEGMPPCPTRPPAPCKDRKCNKSRACRSQQVGCPSHRHNTRSLSAATARMQS